MGESPRRLRLRALEEDWDTVSRESPPQIDSPFLARVGLANEPPSKLLGWGDSGGLAAGMRGALFKRKWAMGPYRSKFVLASRGMQEKYGSMYH